jgi:hypothetical protein
MGVRRNEQSIFLALQPEPYQSKITWEYWHVKFEKEEALLMPHLKKLKEDDLYVGMEIILLACSTISKEGAWPSVNLNIIREIYEIRSIDEREFPLYINWPYISPIFTNILKGI